MKWEIELGSENFQKILRLEKSWGISKRKRVESALDKMRGKEKEIGKEREKSKVNEKVRDGWRNEKWCEANENQPKSTTQKSVYEKKGEREAEET